jgi:Replication-relaxation
MYPQFTARDKDILIDVYSYRYLSASQIQRLHFPSKRTSQLRLRTLLELGYLKSFTTPNIAERIFYLDKKGAEVIAAEWKIDIEKLGWQRRNQPKDYYFLKHFLAVNDFRILVTKACQTSDISLLGFIPEYVGEQSKQGYVKKYIRDSVHKLSHTPDAVFALQKNNKPALFFAEIDRGTELITDPEKGLLKAIIFYLNYWQAKGYSRYEKDFNRQFETARILILTTTQTRLQHIREVVTKLDFSPKYVKRFLWGTSEKEAIFSSVWQSLDTSDNEYYAIE